VMMAGMLAYLDYKETTLRYTIQIGQCEKWECDPFHSHGKIEHAARGPWQAHYSTLLTQEQWNKMAGTSYESVHIGSLYSAKLLSGYRSKCRSLEGAFSGYAKGGYCYWPGGTERAAGARAAAKQIRILMTQKDDAIAKN